MDEVLVGVIRLVSCFFDQHIHDELNLLACYKYYFDFGHFSQIIIYFMLICVLISDVVNYQLFCFSDIAHVN